MKLLAKRAPSAVSAFVLALLAQGCGGGPDATATSADSLSERSALSGYVALELDGASAGLVATYAGSSRCPTGLCLDAAPSAPVSAWLDAWLQGRGGAHRGALIRYDRDGRAVERTEFEAAELVRAEVAPLARAGRDGAALRLQLAPTALRSGPTRAPALSAVERVLAVVSPESTFAMQGLPAACAAPEVTGPFAVSPASARGDGAVVTATLSLRFPGRCRAYLDAAARAGALMSATHGMVYHGRHSELLELTLEGLGIQSVSAAPSEGHEDKVDVVVTTRAPVRASHRVIPDPR